ncbi:MAG TPA: thioredoxin domain-containing protein, partial [Gemmatimonadales bacterium]|nr:thioredoxin domain-containing protein [Gemmatimonadales bacterium]
MRRLGGWMAGALLGLGTALAPSPVAAQSTAALAARSKGAATAPVTVYEMSDFQCPFCRRFALEVFPALEAEYVRTGRVRWVFVNFPLTSIHPNAEPAAELAMCAARAGGFWPVHDLLYRHQPTWAPLQNPAPFFLSLADSARVPRDAVAACLERGETRAEVRQDAEGAARTGARSTPTFYIEGGLLRGAQP